MGKFPAMSAKHGDRVWQMAGNSSAVLPFLASIPELPVLESQSRPNRSTLPAWTTPTPATTSEAQRPVPTTPTPRTSEAQRSVPTTTTPRTTSEPQRSVPTTPTPRTSEAQRSVPTTPTPRTTSEPQRSVPTEERTTSIQAMPGGELSFAQTGVFPSIVILAQCFLFSETHLRRV